MNVRYRCADRLQQYVPTVARERFDFVHIELPSDLNGITVGEPTGWSAGIYQLVYVMRCHSTLRTV